MREFFNYANATREEWLQKRREGIGASEISAILGCNPYLNAYSVWADKTGRLPLDHVEDTWEMSIGRAVETLLLEQCGRDHGFPVFAPKVIYQHPICPRALFTPDGFGITNPTGEPDGRVDIPIECKSSRVRDMWADGAPDHYRFQAMWALAISGAPYAIISATIAGWAGFAPPVYFRVDRDDVAIEAMLDAAETFFRKYVETDTPPPVMDSHDAAVMLSITPQVPDKVVVASVPNGNADDLIAAKAEWDRLEAEASAKSKDIEAQLIGAIGDGKFGVTPKHLVTLSRWEQDRFDQSKIKEKHPKLFARYRMTVPMKRLTFKPLDALPKGKQSEYRALLEGGTANAAE